MLKCMVNFGDFHTLKDCSLSHQGSGEGTKSLIQLEEPVHTKKPEAIFPWLSSRSPSNKQTFRSLANLIVTQRAPKTARDQPFLHTHSVKTMSTWQRSCICNIHFILANGTYLATMGIGHWKILLHQDLSTICVPRRPKQCQLLSRQIQLEKNFETPGLLQTPWCHSLSSLHSQSQSFGRDSHRSSA